VNQGQSAGRWQESGGVCVGGEKRSFGSGFCERFERTGSGYQIRQVRHVDTPRAAVVSRDRGQELSDWLEQRLRQQIAVVNDEQRAVLITRLCSVYRAANKNLEGVGEDLRSFAFEPFNAILHKQVDNADSLIGTMDAAIREINGDWCRLEFFVYHIEHEPARTKLRGQGIWQRYSYPIAESRRAVREWGDLELRFLKIVLGELERDLRAGDLTNGQMYCVSNYFWKEKEADFHRLVEQVDVERKGSGRAVQRIAAYLYRGLGDRARAVEMLLAADESWLLDENEQATLVHYLHQLERWQESIAILKPLIRKHREKIEYTVQLMRAYFHIDRDRPVVTLLTAADQYFRRDGRWTAANIWQLADTSIECQLFSQLAGYYRELISLHEWTQPHRGVGNGTLSSYYIRLAQAYSQLHRTADAVDSAASAIMARNSDSGTVNEPSIRWSQSSIMPTILKRAFSIWTHKRKLPTKIVRPSVKPWDKHYFRSCSTRWQPHN